MQFLLPREWAHVLQSELTTSWYSDLLQSVEAEYQHDTIFPPANTIFAALHACPPATVKVVIIGQDPYHGDNQAHGLAFSVQSGNTIPPSLRNIYKEIKSDTGLESTTDGDLTPWATQGVLLLNSTLTVRKGLAHSHHHLGWERFTDLVLKRLSAEYHHIVYLLWGNAAKRKAINIDTKHNLILSTAHPSPLSAHRGFFGSRHFTKANTYLEECGRTPIRW